MSDKSKILLFLLLMILLVSIGFFIVLANHGFLQNENSEISQHQQDVDSIKTIISKLIEKRDTSINETLFLEFNIGDSKSIFDNKLHLAQRKAKVFKDEMGYFYIIKAGLGNINAYIEPFYSKDSLYMINLRCTNGKNGYYSDAILIKIDLLQIYIDIYGYGSIILYQDDLVIFAIGNKYIALQKNNNVYIDYGSIDHAINYYRNQLNDIERSEVIKDSLESAQLHDL